METAKKTVADVSYHPQLSLSAHLAIESFSTPSPPAVRFSILFSIFILEPSSLSFTIRGGRSR